ncbi:MAG: helix-turn-helix domain-containing protein [Planctomycetota bacterium]
MLHLELVSLDPAHAVTLRGRLGDRGHHVRIRPPAPGPGRRGGAARHHAPSDAILVAAGRTPLARTNLAEVLAASTGPRDDGTRPFLILCAQVDPTSEALEALYAAGFDVVLGAGMQRDIELHIEALARCARRGTPSAAPQAPAISPGLARSAPELDAAVRAARANDDAAARRAARAWWSTDTLDDAELRDLVVRAAQHERHLVIRGERGVGCRHIARVIHQVSERAGAFVEVAGDRLQIDVEELRPRLTELLALAHAGTLCVTGLLGLRSDRAELLWSMLESHRTTRFILTSSPGGAPDLIKRRRCEALDVAPLRERLDSIPQLVRRLARMELSPQALGALKSYPWPGNIAELEAVMESVGPQVVGSMVTLEDLPPSIAACYREQDELVPQTGLPKVPKAHEWQITEHDPIDYRVYERKLLLRALAACGGNRAKAAALLGLGKSTLYRRLSEL